MRLGASPDNVRPLLELQLGAAGRVSRFRVMLYLAALVIVWASYVLGLVIYRLWFSPLAKFPGPKIAAATLWYETYHDAFRWGQYTFEIAKMHEKYGKLSIATQRFL